MKINSITKKSLLLISLAMVSTTYQTQAAPIEHIGDRYIMHLQEMELTGEESLLDVLMMCPEVISLDGNNIIGGDPFANLYGKFVIRIDNQEYGLDYATFLHHFKAREIETIKVCQNAEVMKGCSSLKKVIDITLRKKENGTTGRWGLFGDTYGDHAKIEEMEGIKQIGYITQESLGRMLITRDGQEFELKAQGWNPLKD